MANLQKGVLDKVEHYLGKQSYNWEVIVVDDGSTDGSVEFIERFCQEDKRFTLIKNSHSGKAGAVTAGMLAVTGEIRLFTDMDQATPIEEVEKLLPFFKEGCDVVIGSRKERKGSPFIRRFISQSAAILRKTIVGLSEISDTQCGFKAFTGDASEKLFKKINDLHHGFSKISGSSVTSGFDVELLYLGKEMKYKIKEVPVDWLYVETRRVNPITDSIQGVLDLLSIKKKQISGSYK